MTLRQRKNSSAALSSAGVALRKSDCPGDEWVLRANVSPDRQIVCSGMARVCQEGGGAFLNHTKVPHGLLVALENSQPYAKVSGLDIWNIGSTTC